jgi:DNA-binding transcriptional LysR family regulator
VLPAAGHYHRRRLESVFESERLPYPIPQIECGSTDFIKKIVSETDHLGVVAAMGLGKEEGISLSEIPLNSPFMVRPIGVMWRNNAILSQPALFLMKALREACSEMKISET